MTKVFDKMHINTSCGNNIGERQKIQCLSVTRYRDNELITNLI